MIGVLSVMSACTTTPDFDYEPVFEDRDPPEVETNDPIPAPDVPEPVEGTRNTITFDREAMAAIQTAFEAAESNAESLRRANNALSHLQDENAFLTDAGAAREAMIDRLRVAYRMAVWRERAAWGVAAGSLILIPFSQ